MYGVPETLDLTFLHGREVVQVCLGQYQIQLWFYPDAVIAVGGEWELLDADGRELDRCEPGQRTKPFQLHRLLGVSVVGSEIAAPQWLSLCFTNGDVLKLFDNSPEFESFSIQPGDIVV